MRYESRVRCTSIVILVLGQLSVGFKHRLCTGTYTSEYWKVDLLTYADLSSRPPASLPVHPSQCGAAPVPQGPYQEPCRLTRRSQQCSSKRARRCALRLHSKLLVRAALLYAKMVNGKCSELCDFAFYVHFLLSTSCTIQYLMYRVKIFKCLTCFHNYCILAHICTGLSLNGETLSNASQVDSKSQHPSRVINSNHQTASKEPLSSTTLEFRIDFFICSILLKYTLLSILYVCAIFCFH